MTLSAPFIQQTLFVTHLKAVWPTMKSNNEIFSFLKTLLTLFTFLTTVETFIAVTVLPSHSFECHKTLGHDNLKPDSSAG